MWGRIGFNLIVVVALLSTASAINAMLYGTTSPALALRCWCVAQASSADFESDPVAACDGAAVDEAGSQQIEVLVRIDQLLG